MSRRDSNWDHANNAKIYIGDMLCATMPANVEKSKLYTFECQLVGDHIKILTGREDG